MLLLALIGVLYVLALWLTLRAMNHVARRNAEQDMEAVWRANAAQWEGEQT